MSVKAVRNAAFVFLCVVMFMAQSRGVLAWGNPFGAAATSWSTNFSPRCSLNLFTVGLVWNQIIHCDFDDNDYPDDPLTWGAAMADELYDDCNSTCENHYIKAVADFNNEPENWECYVGWGIFSSQAGYDDSWVRCECDSFRWCWDR